MYWNYRTFRVCGNINVLSQTEKVRNLENFARKNPNVPEIPNGEKPLENMGDSPSCLEDGRIDCSDRAGFSTMRESRTLSPAGWESYVADSWDECMIIASGGIFS
jgi:hypothetical protein